MRIIMDADCLIKLTKARLKETVCSHFTIVIPRLVKCEVVDNAKGHLDSRIIQENLDRKLLTVSKAGKKSKKGEEAALRVFRQGGFDKVGSDDKRFVRYLRILGVPYVTPSMFILLLVREGKMRIDEANKRLELLAPFVSADEYAVVKLKLDALKSGGPNED